MTDHTPPTDQQLDEYEAIANAATDGPWCTDSWEIYQGAEYQVGAAWIGETCRGPVDSWEQDNANAAFAAAARTAMPALVAEVRRLRAPVDRVRALALLEAADFLRDAHFRDGLTVQEIGTALRHTADEADPMVGSLARDGFGLDEIADMLSRPAVPAAEEQPAACGKCKRPFDPADTSFDGRARHAETPFCRGCVDACHESTDAFHRCAVCDSYEAGE